MVSKHLTKTVVEALKPGEVAWDDAIPGFGARHRGQSITYTVKLAFKDALGVNRDRWHRIGTHGQPWTHDNGAWTTLTCEIARSEAMSVRGAANRGELPTSKEDAAKTRLTLRAYAARYLAEHAVPNKASSSVRNDRSMLDNIIIPKLGHVLLAEINVAHADGLKAALRATPVRANRVIALLSSMMSKAEAWGLRPLHSNPCVRLMRFRETPRRRYLSLDELGRLGATLQSAEVHQPIPVAIIRLLLFTGMRSDEALSLKWEHVDRTRNVIALPTSKTGAKEIPLNAPALALLEQAKRFRRTGNPFVFPAQRQLARYGGAPRHYVGLAHAWSGTIAQTKTAKKERRWKRAVPARTGIRQAARLPDLHVHDLRQSHASIAVSGGATLPIIGALLGHRSAATSARYAHLHDSPVRAAAEMTGATIAAALRQTQAIGKAGKLDVLVRLAHVRKRHGVR